MGKAKSVVKSLFDLVEYFALSVGSHDDRNIVIFILCVFFGGSFHFASLKFVGAACKFINEK